MCLYSADGHEGGSRSSLLHAEKQHCTGGGWLMALKDFFDGDGQRELELRRPCADESLANAWVSQKPPSLQSGVAPRVPLARQVEKHLMNLNFASRPTRAKREAEVTTRWQNASSAEALRMVQLRGCEEWVSHIAASIEAHKILAPPWRQMQDHVEQEDRNEALDMVNGKDMLDLDAKEPNSLHLFGVSSNDTPEDCKGFAHESSTTHTS